MAGEYNRSTSGQAGTGSAFILPQSRAFESLLQNIDNNRRQGLLNIQSQKADAALTNKAFLDNQLKAKNGILFQDELNSASQKWMEQGAKYRMQGFNPFSPDANDPNQIKASNDYLRDKAVIEGMADTRDIYQKNYLQQRQQFEKGGYDEDSYRALEDFYGNAKLQDLYKSGALPPTLMKQFNVNDFLGKVKATPVTSNQIVGNMETTTTKADEDAIRQQINGHIKLDPQAERTLTKKWGVNLAETPLGVLTGETDPTAVTGLVDQYLKSPAGVKEALKAFKGTVPSYNSPEYESYRNKAVERQIQQENKYNAGVQDLVETKAAEVEGKTKTEYNFTKRNQELKEQANARANQQLSMSKARFEQWGKDKKNKDQEDNFIKDVASGNPNAINELNAHISEFNGSAKKVVGTTVSINGKGQYVKSGIVVDVPTKVAAVKDKLGNVTEAEKTINHRYLIQDKDSKEARIIINQILNKSKTYGAGKTKKEVPYATENDKELADQGFEF